MFLPTIGECLRNINICFNSYWSQAEERSSAAFILSCGYLNSSESIKTDCRSLTGYGKIPKDNGAHSYGELDPVLFSTVFPELQITFEYLYNGDKVMTGRLTGLGSTDGTVDVFQTDFRSNQVLRLFQDFRNSIITCIRFSPTFNEKTIKFIVNPAVETSYVCEYSMELAENAIKQLPLSEAYDCVNTSCWADVDCDGEDEILIGTFGGVLFIYKAVASDYQLVKQIRTDGPIHSVGHSDLIGDGTRCLFFVTTRGVHIYNHSLDSMAKLLKQRLAHLPLAFSFNTTH
ncbi:hypothetical protein Ciccas_005533 [Cichlidogyrus casuarinus]|uniref:Kaptin n=1 Tax=Cichlidogyrus casuarinus TaxID=1844966 RepID=A0ABD2Q8E4_9PLAT